MTATITVPILGTAHDAAYFQPSELTSADLFAFAYTDGTHAYSIATIQAIRAAGKGICWNHERGPLDLAGGASAGTTAANEAIPPVIEAGTPTDGTVAIVYSVDGNVTQANFAVYAPAFQAIRSVHAGRFLIGFYGELALYKYLKALGLVDVKCWLSASSSFPGYDPNDPDVGVIQAVGTDIANTDRDLVTNYDLGVWWAEGHDPSGGGNQEDDMLLDPTDPIVIELRAAVEGTSGTFLAAMNAKLDANRINLAGELGAYVVGDNTKIDGLTASIAAISQELQTQLPDVDPAKITAAVQAALGHLTVTSTIGESA